MYEENLHKTQTICSRGRKLLRHHRPALSTIVSLFIKLSGYSTQTTTNKYIGDESLTQHSNIAQSNTALLYSGQNTNLFLHRKRQSKQFLELSEGEKKQMAVVR